MGKNIKSGGAKGLARKAKTTVEATGQKRGKGLNHKTINLELTDQVYRWVV